MANANFAVACNDRDDIIRRGNNLLDKIQKREVKQQDGTIVKQDIMKRCEALEMIFAIAEQNLERAMLQKEGVDVAALDASFSAIRAQFASVSKAREQIRFDYDAKLAAERDATAKQTAVMQEKIESLTAAKEDAEKTAEVTTQAAAEAEKDKKAAQEQAETANKLAAEKTRTTEMLTDKLAEAEEKAKSYDTLKAERDELQKELDKAELVRKNEVLAAKFELSEQLRKAEKQLAELQMKLQQKA